MCSQFNVSVSQGISQALFHDIIHHFPNPREFPVRSRSVNLWCKKAIIHRKITVDCFTLLEKVCSFFEKYTFYDIVESCCI